MRITQALLALATAGCCFAQQLDVFYTGRTMGYHRYPNLQKQSDPPGCPNDSKPLDPKDMSLEGQDLYSLRTKAGMKEDRLLVGMGDNFAPQLEARTFSDTPTAKGKDLFVINRQTKAWVDDSQKGQQKQPPLDLLNDSIPADNVACFLSAMHYAALVPGKHDFHFGPDRLRLLAKFLNERNTRMLAANLSIVTTEPEAKPRKPLYEIEDELREKKDSRLSNGRYFTVMPPVPIEKASKADAAPAVKWPDVVLPWKTRFEVQNAYYTTYGGVRVDPNDLPPGASGIGMRERVKNLVICENPTDFAIPPAFALRKPYKFQKPDPGACWATDPGVREKGSITYSLADGKHLEPDRNYAACIELQDNIFENRFQYYCQPFYVARPFFQYPTKEKKLDDTPFAIREVSGQKVAIFGVLDTDLQGKIGRLNYSWWNKDETYETTGQISSLTDALNQAMDRCQEDNDCPGARKILLAQMPAAKATQLLANLSNKPLFDLVITETDSNNATRDGKIERKLAKGKAESPRFVVAPAEMYQSKDEKEKVKGLSTLTSRIAKATVTLPIDATAPWTLDHKIVEVLEPRLEEPQIVSPVQCPKDVNSLRCVAISTLIQEGVRDAPQMHNWSNTQVLQNLALMAMQKHRHADISLLQTRDLFRPEAFAGVPVDAGNLQEKLDRLFWKGDFAVRIPVSGATLTSILQSSKDFASLESSPTNIDPERGRTLINVGYFKEAADSNLTVNGGIIDPAKVYSVSMTDFLALGDTGYTPIKTPLVPYPYRIKDFKDYEAISAIVCEAIKAAVLRNAVCNSLLNKGVKATDHMDISADVPPDRTPGVVSWFQTKSYLDLKSRWSRFKEFYTGQDAAQVASAQKPYWAFDLEKGDFSYKINRTPPSSIISSKFTGIGLADVTSLVSYVVTFDDRARLRYVTRHFDWYLQHESNFSYTRKDTAKANFSRNLDQNSVAAEIGGLGHLIWHQGRKPQGLDFVGALRVESNLFQPRNDISLAAGTLMTRLDRPIDLFAKVGLRYSDERSWIEGGFIGGQSQGAPASYVFNGTRTVKLIPGATPPDPTNPFCDPTDPNAHCNPSNCTMTAPCTSTNVPKTFADTISYLSGTLPASTAATETKKFLTPSSSYTVNYETRPISGLYLNFSFNVPLPLGRKYPDWAGGKPIALLVENSGKWLFDYSSDLPTQTKYYDKVQMSMVIPVIGNLSLKPEIDALYYRNKNSPIFSPPGYRSGNSLHSFNYQATLAYTFSWREGLPLSRMWRYAWPAPTSSVPSSGR